MRRLISVLITATLVGSLALTIGPLAPAGSTPVATEDSTYTTFGRVFPDPHGCDPGGSPFANHKKGPLSGALLILRFLNRPKRTSP